VQKSPPNDVDYEEISRGAEGLHEYTPSPGMQSLDDINAPYPHAYDRASDRRDKYLQRIQKCVQK
jgi:hypothetical protein